MDVQSFQSHVLHQQRGYDDYTRLVQTVTDQIELERADKLHVSPISGICREPFLGDELRQLCTFVEQCVLVRRRRTQIRAFFVHWISDDGTLWGYRIGLSAQRLEGSADDQLPIELLMSCQRGKSGLFRLTGGLKWDSDHPFSHKTLLQGIATTPGIAQKRATEFLDQLYTAIERKDAISFSPTDGMLVAQAIVHAFVLASKS